MIVFCDCVCSSHVSLCFVPLLVANKTQSHVVGFDLLGWLRGWLVGVAPWQAYAASAPHPTIELLQEFKQSILTLSPKGAVITQHNTIPTYPPSLSCDGETSSLRGYCLMF